MVHFSDSLVQVQIIMIMKNKNRFVITDVIFLDQDVTFISYTSCPICDADLKFYDDISNKIIESVCSYCGERWTIDPMITITYCLRNISNET